MRTKYGLPLYQYNQIWRGRPRRHYRIRPQPIAGSSSLLIAHGADVKTVQARLRHGSAKTTLDTYGHLWPDKDESTKAVIDAVVDSKFRDLADSVRTEGGAP